MIKIFARLLFKIVYKKEIATLVSKNINCPFSFDEKSTGEESYIAGTGNGVSKALLRLKLWDILDGQDFDPNNIIPDPPEISYKVYIGDVNFPPDPSNSKEYGSYQCFDTAESVSREIVDTLIPEFNFEGKSSDELFEDYISASHHPFLDPVDAYDHSAFSPLKYARLRCNDIANEKIQFKVFVEDFDSTDESERYEYGSFETYEKAVSACKLIVEDCLPAENFENKSADELCYKYLGSLDDLIITPEPDENPFSVWNYAKSRCEEIAQKVDLS